MKGIESMLFAQALTLQATFKALSGRAAANASKYLAATDTYLRLALTAQGQCRATLETLATIKNPRPVAFVKQANLSNGLQQVNNGSREANKLVVRAREENEIPQNELLTDTRQRMAKPWTPERSARQAEAIHAWQPWKRATGPRSEEGKRRLPETLTWALSGPNCGNWGGRCVSLKRVACRAPTSRVLPSMWAHGAKRSRESASRSYGSKSTPSQFV